MSQSQSAYELTSKEFRLAEKLATRITESIAAIASDLDPPQDIDRQAVFSVSIAIMLRGLFNDDAIENISDMALSIPEDADDELDS